MKKVLILAYHFPPSNAIASKRTLAYANYLSKFGIYPTILTQFLDSNSNQQSVYSKLKEYEVYRINRIPSIRSHIISTIKKSPFKIPFLLLRWFWGFFDYDTQNDHAYAQYKVFLNDHLKTTHYDYILGIYNPHLCLKLAYTFSKKYDIPCFLDFRDLWSIALIDENINFSLSERIQNYFITYYWKKWLKASRAYSITSRVWLDILEDLSSKPGLVIPNGFEDDLLEIDVQKQNGFVIGCMGSFYSNQDLNIFLQGFNFFLDQLSRTDRLTVKLKCLGLSTHYRPKVIDEIVSIIPSENLEFLPRTSTNEAFVFCKSCTILWHPAFTKAKGWFSAKIYDYLASQRPIIFAPTDHGIVEKELHGLSHAIFCQNSEEVKMNLSNLFQLWKQNKLDNIVSPTIEILKFSRSNQVHIMANLLSNEKSVP